MQVPQQARLNHGVDGGGGPPLDGSMSLPLFLSSLYGGRRANSLSLEDSMLGRVDWPVDPGPPHKKQQHRPRMSLGDRDFPSDHFKYRGCGTEKGRD